ncbi:hypothetical protein ES703_14170 [subsurface metagenome]
MNLQEKISRLARHIFFSIRRADRDIDEYWRNFFNKEQDK